MNLPADLPKRRALGKGLDSLLSTPGAAAPVPPSQPAASESAGRPLEIPLDRIERNPFQTRTQFDEAALAELADSIAATGVVQPVLVRPLADGRYQLIAGERRWLASRRAGKETIPAVVRQASDGQAIEMTIVENLQRADLNPMEQARAYERLGREFRLTQEQMAQRTGKDRASVANFLRLLRLPAAVQARVENGELSFGHARTLLALESAEEMERAAQKIAALSMSVRQAESYVQGLIHPERAGKEPAGQKPADPNVREAELQLQQALGLRVRIEDRKGRGRVIIEYSKLEDFDALFETLAARHG